MKKIKVVVLLGGKSAERDISLLTGKEVIKNLDRKKYNVTAVEIPKKGTAWIFKLIKSKPDAVFVALHGPYGEDGTIQGLLELLGIPYTFSGVFASALAMDKFRTTKLMETNGFSVPKSFLAKKNNYSIPLIQKTIGFPCVVKPNRLGSSVGITVNIQNIKDLEIALKAAFRYDSEVCVESHISGREITAPILGNGSASIKLPLIEIIPKIGNFYNYSSKYAKGGSDHVVPAKIPEVATRKIQEAAFLAHSLIGARGVTRSDFILDGSTPYFLEINTIPGMTGTSLVPDSARAAGITFPKLLDKLISLCLSAP